MFTGPTAEAEGRGHHYMTGPLQLMLREKVVISSLAYCCEEYSSLNDWACS